MMARRLHFGLIYPKDIVPEHLWFAEMQLCKPKLRCHVLFGEGTLSLRNPVRGKFDLSFSCNPDKYELQLTEKSSLASRWQTIQSYTAGCLASTYKPKNIPLVNID